MNPISPIGQNWHDFEKEIFTEQELNESNLRVALISELIHARQEQGISQKRLDKFK